MAAPKPKYTLTVNRALCQKRDRLVMEKYLDYFLDRAFRAGRGSGWDASHRFLGMTNGDDLWIYHWKLTFRKISGPRQNVKLLDRQFEKIREHFLIAIRGKLKVNPFVVIEKQGDQEVVVGEKEVSQTVATSRNREEKDYSDIHVPRVEDPQYFGGIFDRDWHIQRIQSAICLAKKTGMRKRCHVLLYGPPGSAKTELLSCFAKALGREDEDYMMIDATSTTQAGILHRLMNTSVIPSVLMIEEIEKTDESALRWLLGILDHRAQIRRLNARVGHQYRNIRLLCLATANNRKLFKKVMSGALASRFSHQIYCPRPTRQTMELILKREVDSIDGNPQWIKPAIDFCYDELSMDDPREIIPICLCGAENLLDGSYQETIRKTLPPEGEGLG